MEQEYSTYWITRFPFFANIPDSRTNKSIDGLISTLQDIRSKYEKQFKNNQEVIPNEKASEETRKKLSEARKLYVQKKISQEKTEEK